MKRSVLRRKSSLRRRSYLKRTRDEKWDSFRSQQARRWRNTEGNLRCAGCGVEAPELDYHHLIGRNVRPDLKYDPSNLLWLCRRCHRKAHTTVCPKDAK